MTSFPQEFVFHNISRNRHTRKDKHLNTSALLPKAYAVVGQLLSPKLLGFLESNIFVSARNEVSIFVRPSAESVLLPMAKMNIAFSGYLSSSYFLFPDD